MEELVAVRYTSQLQGGRETGSHRMTGCGLHAGGRNDYRIIREGDLTADYAELRRFRHWTTKDTKEAKKCRQSIQAWLRVKPERGGAGAAPSVVVGLCVGGAARAPRQDVRRFREPG